MKKKLIAWIIIAFVASLVVRLLARVFGVISVEYDEILGNILFFLKIFGWFFVIVFAFSFFCSFAVGMFAFLGWLIEVLVWATQTVCGKDVPFPHR